MKKHSPFMRLEYIKEMHQIIDEMEASGAEINKSRVISAYRRKHNSPTYMFQWVQRTPEILERIEKAREKSVCWNPETRAWTTYSDEKRKALEEERKKAANE